jgi:hypothetical protein
MWLLTPLQAEFLSSALRFFGTLLLGAVFAQFIRIFLPERIRVWFALREKLLSKWIRNPSYTVGITTRLDCRQPIEVEAAKKQIKALYRDHDLTTAGTDLHFQDKAARGYTNTRIQFAYEADKRHDNDLMLYSINVTVEAQTRYRAIRDSIEDLRAALSSAEDVLIRGLACFAGKRALYIEVARLEEFSEWLENLQATQITGKIKNIEAEFAYHDNRLVIEDTINSATLAWLKNIVAHVG